MNHGEHGETRRGIHRIFRMNRITLSTRFVFYTGTRTSKRNLVNPVNPVHFWFLLFSVSLCVLRGSPCQAQGKPLTLEESVALALKQNPMARAARFSREASQIQVEREKPVFRPIITAVVSRTLQGPRVTFPRPDGTGGVVLPEDFAQLHVIIEQTLYRAGLGAARQRYTAQSTALEYDLRKAQADIALAARKAYLDVLRAEAGVRLAREGLELAGRYRALVQKQIEAGVAKPVDLQTVGARVAEAQAGMTKAEGGLELARLNFNREMGRSLTELVQLEPLLLQPSIPNSPEEAIAVALKQRPELLALEQSLLATQAGVSLAKTQGQPSLNVRGQFIEQTRTALLPQTYAAAMLEVRWPILDGGKSRFDALEAKAQAQRLEALLESARQGVTLDVRQAWQKMREARDRIQLAQEQVRGAEATATVAEKAYEVGRGILFEVLSAQREVHSAREREREAIYDLYAAEADFLLAQGALLPASPPVTPEGKPK
jgi:outer membrane protein